MQATDHVHEERRLELLQALGVLDTAPEAAFDALVAAAAAIAGCPMAVLSLADRQRHWFKARHGLNASELPRELAFCEMALRQPEGFELPDARADAHFAVHPMVTGSPHLRFCAGLPVQVDGVRLGALCVLDTQVRALSPSQREALAGLARAASALLAQRRSQRALQTHSERLYDLARASGDWMWEVDERLRYRWISGEYEAITGMSADTMIGQPVVDEPRVDVRGRLLSRKAGLLALVESREPFARTITLKATPRGTLHVSRSATPVFDADGRFRGWRGTARDVTAQIAAEREALQQHELLAKLSSQVPGVIFQYRLEPGGEGHYLYASEGVRQVFGVELRPGRRLDASLPARLLHPDDVPGFQESILDAAERLRPWSREYRIRRKDGSLRWLDTRATPERLADGSTLFHGFTADITDRKQAELALRDSETRWERAADAAGIGLVEVDLQQERLTLDRRACQVHGLPHPHPPLSLQDWIGRVHPEDRARALLGLQRAHRPGGHTAGRVRLSLPDGRERHLELAADARCDERGRVTGLFGTCRDVSEQIRHEALQRDKEAAERANLAKSEFLSRVSHELRTPLNSILGFAQLMTMDEAHPLAPEQQRRLAGVQRAGSHLLDLIDEVLDLTRIERGSVDLPLQPVDLHASVAGCLRLLQPLAAQHEVELPVATADGPCWVQGDARSLEQVLMNLLSNAIKYNRPGRRVRLDLVRDASRVQLSVIDEGEGLTPEQQAQLFQPFNRLGAERRRVEGTGLGLVIARELTLAMEGRLEVQSQPGEGSRFTVVLWAADGPAESEPLAAAERDAEEAPLQPRHVLYIEDEPLNAILMQEVFRTRPQWTLHLAEDGARGLQLARRLKPDLLLIDINLPDMDGLQVVSKLRADHRTARLRCVAFSADAMREQVDAAMKAGFDDYWTKPIDLKRMLELLSQQLGRRERQVEA